MDHRTKYFKCRERESS